MYQQVFTVSITILVSSFFLHPYYLLYEIITDHKDINTKKKEILDVLLDKFTLYTVMHRFSLTKLNLFQKKKRNVFFYFFTFSTYFLSN